jgi:asparagine synthase (glutamine-hydrolysing)
MTDHTHETMFRQVYQLQGGQFLEVSLDPANSGFARPITHTWWTLPARPVEPPMTLDEAARKFRTLLEDSVRLRLRSDVPLGSCLSGGLDSSAVVCMVNRILGREKSQEIQNTFSSCFEDPRYDERTYIEEVIAKTHVESHYVFPDPEAFFELLHTITWHQDEPFGSMSIFAQWHVFELARSHGVKVMLDGQGADELLGGYHTYFWALLAGLARTKHFRDLLGEMRAIRERHSHGLADILIRLGYFLSPRRIRPMGRSLMGMPDTPAWIDPRAVRNAAIRPSEGIAEPCSSIRSLSRAQLLRTNLPALLHYEDRNSMAHSVEARVPFLDYRLVEFAYCLPDMFKIKDGETKKILRLAMKDIVPDKVLKRQDKMAFAMPEEHWIRESHSARFHAVLKESAGHLGPWIDHAKLEAMFRSVTDGSRAFDWSIWRIINAGTWAGLFRMDMRDGL